MPIRYTYPMPTNPTVAPLTMDDLTDLERWGVADGFTTLEEIAKDRATAARWEAGRLTAAAGAERIRQRLADEAFLATPAARAAAAAIAQEEAEAAPSPEPAPAPIVPAEPLATQAAAPAPGPLANVATFVRDHATKFEDGDVTPELTAAACAWLRSYAGDFDWLHKQRRLLDRGFELYPATIRGVLNSWRAEARRATAAAPSNPPAVSDQPADRAMLWQDRPNRYPGSCLRCRVHVPANSGTTRKAGRSWVVLCAEHSDGPVTAAAPAPPAPAPEPLPDVPAGRYAVELAGAPLRFYRVDRPTEGVHAGRTFVAVQASDDLWPVRDRNSKRAILEAIAVDLQAARMRYATELGRCYRCGRTLTDAVSRELGIGPDCRAAAA